MQNAEWFHVKLNTLQYMFSPLICVIPTIFRTKQLNYLILLPYFISSQWFTNLLVNSTYRPSQRKHCISYRSHVSLLGQIVCLKNVHLVNSVFNYCLVEPRNKIQKTFVLYRICESSNLTDQSFFRRMKFILTWKCSPSS